MSPTSQSFKLSLVGSWLVKENVDDPSLLVKVTMCKVKPLSGSR